MARAGLSALLLAFAVAALLRLNGFCLLEPDSPSYLIGAKSIASLHGYRDLDRPGEPLHTFRPPGLPLLLVPLSWLAPYSVVGGKLVVLAFALASIAMVARLAARGGSAAGALGAAALFAASPYALLHATEVASEFPYLACSLAAILLLTRPGGAPARREVALAAAILAFLPFLRTIGVALVLAALAVCLVDRRRRGWWPAPAVALAATALWMLRNRAAGGPTYFGAIAADLSRTGAAGFAAKAAAALGFYASRFLDVLLPGVWPGRPLYERMTVGGTPDLGGLHGGGWIVAAAILALAGWGAWSRRREEGTLAVAYAAAFALVLAIYPPRHERLTWPLVPLAWALVPSGLDAARRALAARAPLGSVLRVLAVAVPLAILGIEGAASLAMVRDNRASATGGDRFYDDRNPPLYFVDWRRAGEWLGANAPTGARVLTRHTDVYFTSGRTQDSARFEELPPSVWRGRIGRLHARYLVVPTALYGKFFPFELLGSDPAYSYSIRWQGRGAAVVEVSPNRTGRVSPPAAIPAGVLDACEAAFAREPRRVDLATRCAELLAMSGRRDEAIARLTALVAKGGADVRIQVALAQGLLDAGRADEAAVAFRAASALPEAELLEQTIARGVAASIERGRASALDPLVRARAAAVRAGDRMDALRWDQAIADVQEALGLQPGDAPVLATAADLALRLDDLGRAIDLYRRAGAAGDPHGAAKAAALADAAAVETRADAAGADELARAASFWAQEGAPGRSLAILERAAHRFPSDPSIAAGLARLRAFYGLD